MIGRPPTKDAPPFGRRLAALCNARGLTQRELADLFGVPREMVDYYERRAKTPALAVVERAAEALGVSAAELLGVAMPKGRRGPTGKLRQVSEDAARLPRRQQEKIADFVSAYVKQYEHERQS